MTPEDPLMEIAGAVADGSPIDWGVAESGASSRDDLEDIRQLRAIAAIARAHRRLSELPVDDVTAESLSASVSEPHPAPAAPQIPESERRDAQRWGSLVVLEKLGAGSFGDVFRAWDTSLDREVALKLLRRRRRGKTESIIREGQLLARISHPNVMVIHGAQEIDGQVGIWGEFLKGRTLARLVRDDGPLSAGEALVVSDSISRALAAAHRAGLLHRDVKAQNVMRERGGRVVLMDFGLGQQFDELASEQTVDLAGTPLYMAPELFVGGRPSIQSDLYSLGVLMFYLASGTFPVTGATSNEIAAAHAAGRRVTLRDLRPDLPTPFVQVVERALHPDPGGRFESAGAMQAAITAASQPLRAPDASRPGLAALREPVVAAALATAVILAAGVGTWLTWWMRPTVIPRVERLVGIEPPPGTRFSDSSRTMPAISPDGKYVAFSATDIETGTINLWLHSFATATATVVEGSHGAHAPFWAPDSKSLGFIEGGGAIKRLPLGGKVRQTVETGQEPRGAAVNARGVLLFPKGPRSGLYAVSATGEDRSERLILAPDPSQDELGFMWPEFLPDGERFVYFVLSDKPSVRGLYLGSLAGGRGRRLTGADASGTVSGDRLLFVKGGDLVAQRFIADEGRVDGTPVTVASRVAVAFEWRSIVSAANDGTIVFLPAMEDRELVWFDRAGAQVGKLDLPPGRYRSPALSPDGTLLAVQHYRDGLSEIQVIDLQSGQTRPNVADSADVQFPVWGRKHHLAYASADSGRMEIYIRNFDSDAPARRLDLGDADPADSDKMPTDWSLDGEHLLVVNRSIDRLYNLWVVPVDRPTEAVPLRPGEGSQYGGRLSPDGRTAIYVRRVRPKREGAPPERELWACDFPSGKNPRLIESGKIDPAWPSNEAVSFLDRAGRLTVLPFGPRGTRSEPLTTFLTGVDTPEGSRNSYAWTSDGQRVLVNRPISQPEQRRVMMLLGHSR